MNNAIFLVLINLVALTELLPVTVPTYYNSYTRRQIDVSQQPNSLFNRLTNNLASDSVNNQNQNQHQNDDVQVDEYQDYEDLQTDKPVPTNENYLTGPGGGGGGSNPNYSINNLYNYWFSQNKRQKRKKRKKGPQPCVPLSYTNNNHNRFKRDTYTNGDGKTFSLVLGDYNTYGGYGGGNYGSGYAPSFDNTNPQYDKPDYSLQQVQYQPFGGYPCIPISFHRPHRPFRPYGGGGSGWGFFGNGGLLDFGGDSRPPNIIANQPLRPPFGLVPSNDGAGGGGGGVGTIWGTVLDKVNEFVSILI